MGPPRRGDVYLCELYPTVGSEIRKTRPVLVVSPDELNDHMRSCLVAPMTTGGHPISVPGCLPIPRRIRQRRDRPDTRGGRDSTDETARETPQLHHDPGASSGARDVLRLI